MRLFEGFLAATDIPLSVFKRLNSIIVMDYYKSQIDANVFQVAVKLTSAIYNKLLSAKINNE
jgi:hypothetical protein